jgi:glycosyltransferase involved in cell wall biosynthesis
MKRLYVLAAHEPHLDPRIDWVAELACRFFDVTVIGIGDTPPRVWEGKSAPAYKTEQLKLSSQGAMAFCWALCRSFWARPKFWLGLTMSACAAIVIVPIQLLRTLYRVAVPGFVRSRLRRAVKAIFNSRWFPGSLRRSLQLIAHHFVRVSWEIRRRLAITAVTLHQGLHKMPRPDVIYCNDLDTVLAAVILKRTHGCNVIFDAHEFWSHMNPESVSWEEAIYRAYERELLRRVDCAFTVNHLLAEQMERLLGYHFESLPNCVPVEGAWKTPPAWAPQITSVQSYSAVDPRSVDAIAQGRVRFLFQGGFAAHRGLEELLQAWSHISSDKAVLFMRGRDNAYRAELVALASRLGILGKSVYFIEPVQEHDLVRAAAECDVGIIPYKAVTINYRYCCPNKLSQYMQAGLAIMTNSLDYVREIVERYECGVTYDVTSEGTIVAAANRLIEDEVFRRTCQRQGKKMAGLEYNWETLSRPLRSYFAQLAGLDLSITESRPRLARRA